MISKMKTCSHCKKENIPEDSRKWVCDECTFKRKKIYHKAYHTNRKRKQLEKTNDRCDLCTSLTPKGIFRCQWCIQRYGKN